jgi:leucyl-tRNA synthetase
MEKNKMNINTWTGHVDNHRHELYNHRALEQKWMKLVQEKEKEEPVSFPGDLLQDFGFDVLHLYCICQPVPKTNDDWDEEVVSALYRFLKRFWAFATVSLRVDLQQTIERRSIRNRLVRAVTSCRGKKRPENAPAAFMKALRELYEAGVFRNDSGKEEACRGCVAGERAADRETIRDYLILFAAFAPVMCAELWSRISDAPISSAKYPEVGTVADESVFTDDKVDLSKVQPIMYDSSAKAYRVIGEKVAGAWDAGKKFM